MKRFLLLLLVCISGLNAATPVSGIISSNTTWTKAGSPYQLTGRVQVAKNVTLTIQAGAAVEGSDNVLEIFGRLDVQGISSAMVSLTRVRLIPGPGVESEPSRMEIAYADISGGSLWEPGGNAVYSSIAMRFSRAVAVSSPIYLWYPTSDCVFERNSFIRCGSFSVGINNGVTVRFADNLFWDPQPGPGTISNAAITVWATYAGSTVVAERNSFLNIKDGYALSLPVGYPGDRFNAVRNYWGGLSTAQISALIFDKNDDLRSAGTIPFLPVLDFATIGTPTPPVAPSVPTVSGPSSVKQGESFTLTAQASGSDPLRYQWSKDGTNISGATSSTLTLPAATSANAGLYRVVATNDAGAATSPPFSVSVILPTPRLANLSTLSGISSTQPMTVGFVIQGAARKTLLFRAIGPGLQQFGVANVLPDPRLDVGGRLYDDWSAAERPADVALMQSVGAFPLPPVSLDSVAVVNLTPGAATAFVGSIGNSTGNVLLEAYDAEPSSASNLVNLSVMRFVSSTGIKLVVGFVLVGSGDANLLIRAVGPALAGFNVGGPLTDPDLEVYRGQTLIYRNDDYLIQANGANISAISQRVGAFSLSGDPKLNTGKDAAAYLRLTEGAYTVIIDPKAAPNTRNDGQVLLELYVVPEL